MSTYSSYFSNILTTTSSKYSQLRQKLTNSEADGDTEDDSHISRVLRAYYTEKGGRWPEWLGPDPRAPAPQVVQSSSGAGYYGGYGQQPGGYVSSAGATGQQQQQQPQQAQQQAGRWGRGGLSDLWDSGGKGPEQQQQEPASLRARPGMQAANSSAAGSNVNRADALGGRFGRQTQPGDPSPQARPLPSQRAGSYQSQFVSPRPPPNDAPSASSAGSAGSAAGTASDRLKQRLWGSGRAGSPTPSAGSGASGGYGNDSGGRASPYETRNSNPYDNPRAPAGGSSSQPLVSANSPWSNDGADPYAPSGGGGGAGAGGNPYASSGGAYGGSSGYGGGPYASSGQRYPGLPSGPRPAR